MKVVRKKYRYSKRAGVQKKKIKNNFALLKVPGWSVLLMRAQTFNH